MLDLVCWSFVVAVVPIVLAVASQIINRVAKVLEPARSRPFVLHTHACYAPYGLQQRVNRAKASDDER